MFKMIVCTILLCLKYNTCFYYFFLLSFVLFTISRIFIIIIIKYLKGHGKCTHCVYTGTRGAHLKECVKMYIHKKCFSFPLALFPLSGVTYMKKMKNEKCYVHSLLLYQGDMMIVSFALYKMRKSSTHNNNIRAKWQLRKICWRQKENIIIFYMLFIICFTSVVGVR